MRRRPSHRSASAVSAAVESLEPRTLLSFAAHVDFQPSTVAVYRGYVMDSGATYGSRGNGYTYGWNAPDNWTRARNSSLSPDQRYDTLNQMQVPGAGTTWEIAVPNGKYQVHIVTGDSQFIDSVYKINAEGVLAVNGTPTKSNHWVQGTVTVTVSDGRLTVSNAAGSVNNKIDFIDVVAAPPPAPTSLKTAASSSSQINLTWSANPTNIDGFTVQRSVNATSFTTIATLAGTATGYASTGLNDGTTYYYRITAFNSTGSSPIASAQATTPLAAPSSLTAVATLASNSDPVTLMWADNSVGAAGYEVDRSTDGVNFTAIATLGAAANTYTDTNVVDGTAYTYSVRALGATGASPAVVVQAVTPVSPPAGLSAVGVMGNEIDLRWTDTSATAAGVQVERSADGVNFTAIAQLGATSTSYTDTGLSSGTTYTYRVDAVSSIAGTSPNSPTASASTLGLIVYDGLLYNNEPSLVPAGLPRVMVTGVGFFDALGNPDQAATDATASQAAKLHENLVIDIETWPADIRDSASSTQTDPALQPQVDATIARFTQIIGWVHAQWRAMGVLDLKVGIYSMLPRPNIVDVTDPAQRAAWQANNDYLLPLAQQVDWVLPALYTSPADTPTTWDVYAQAVIAEARRYGKPVVPFLMPHYDVTSAPLPQDLWQMELDTARRLAGGALLWGGYGQNWDAAAPWWQTLQNSLHNVGRTPPSMPVAATLSSAGLRLSWSDAGNNDTAVMIERSTDGVNFTHVGTVLHGTTTFAQSSLTIGQTYYCRLRATNGFGVSPPTPVLSAVAGRDAFVVAQGADADALSGSVFRSATALCGLDSGWAEFKAMDFGSGASQFAAALAVTPEHAGQQLRIWIDQPNAAGGGTQIGTLTATSTGGWGTVNWQTTAVAHIGGVHDLYIVCQPGGWAIGNLYSFRFGDNAAPAAPTSLLGRSIGGAVGLSWTSNSADATSFAISRSTDGVNFAPLGSVPGTQTAYTDSTVSGTGIFYYDVQAVNAGGASAASNIISAVATTRSAIATIAATSYTDASGVTNIGDVVGYLQNGDWIHYAGLDFGTGVTTFTANFSAPAGNAGQPIQLRIDGPTGPVVGTLMPASTGGWYTFVPQSATVTGLSGIHDLYLVIQGTVAAGNLASLSFS